MRHSTANPLRRMRRRARFLRTRSTLNAPRVCAARASQEAGFDLDLAYVRPKLIAMSVPATGCTALYRNPLGEVVRFFETRHAHEGYLIVNLCPELPYPHDGFRSGSVVAHDVQDHTPPTMAQFVEFLNVAAASATRDRLLAVHCRGGKGRTGCICCAWLLYTRDADDADDALALFALERTELGLGRKKLQGVDTPSQRRYVHQVAALLGSQGAYLSATSTAAAPEAAQPPPAERMSEIPRPIPVQLPQRPSLALSDLELSRWFATRPRGPLVCAVHTELSVRPGPCFVSHWSEPVWVGAEGSAVPDRLVFRLNGARVTGDVRVSVFELPRLLEARRDRSQHGEDPRLPFDHAPKGPWEAGRLSDGGRSGGNGGALMPNGSAAAPPMPAHLSTSELQVRRDTRWITAGKEPGCLFYFIFHTGFVGAEPKLTVPVAMMDRACKNPGGVYHWEGEATLRFATLEDAVPAHVPAPASRQSSTPGSPHGSPPGSPAVTSPSAPTAAPWSLQPTPRPEVVEAV